jgi:cysteine desulfurase
MAVYLDHNATAPLLPEAHEAMLEVLREIHGNPSSTHAFGRAARAVVERARAQVAQLLGVEPREVIFTAGATEANNTAIHGAVARHGSGARVVTTTVEHPSVAEPLAALEKQGLRVSRLPVDGDGRVDPASVEDAIGPDTALVSVILANNETGVLQDAHALREAVAGRCPLHLDATQALGRLPLDATALGADLVCVSAHKLGGPKGVGALVARGLALEPLVRGGPQERRRRGGTENVAAIAGFGAACAVARARLPECGPRLAALRERLFAGLCARVAGVRRNGSAAHVLPNTLNVAFEGVAGEILAEALDGEGIAVSTGAACASGSLEPSPVLLAMGRSEAEARASLRFSLGFDTDEAAIDEVLAVLPGLVERVREVPA